MRTTIIADASYCNESKIAGYGYWIASSRAGKYGGEGVVKGSVETNNAAEMMALANALAIAIKRGMVAQYDEVLLQTDCVAAISGFMGQRTLVIAQEQDVYDWFCETRANLKLLTQFRHVKGHTMNKDARSTTNRMCDKRAKRAMRRARVDREAAIEIPRIQQLLELD